MNDTPLRTPPAVWAACAALGVASCLLPATLGYDPWSWMVWARQVVHLQLDTSGGPSWKPLPVLVTAPLAAFGGAAPQAWMALSRASAACALVLGYRIVHRVTGVRAAGAFAVAGLACSTDLFDATLRGYSEPVLVALVLGAVDRATAKRPTTALVLVCAAGLLRPELWVFGIIGAGWVWVATRPGLVRSVGLAALAAAPAAIWLVLDKLGSGDALESSRIARTSPPGSAAATASPTLTVLERMVDAVTPPVAVLVVVGVVLAVRRRRRLDLLLVVAAVAWVAEIAVFAETGYTGRRRYLLVAAALSTLAAAVGLGRLTSVLSPRRRGALLAAVTMAVGGWAFAPLRHDWRRMSVGPALRRQQRQLFAAVDAAGGRRAVLRRGTPVVNDDLQAALAWKLRVALGDVHHPAGFRHVRLGYRPPAVVFRGPRKLAGQRPVLAPGAARRIIAGREPWTVYAVGVRRGATGR